VALFCDVFCDGDLFGDNRADQVAERLVGISAEVETMLSIAWRVLLVIGVIAILTAVDRALTPLAY
jgi:hypothetical protein